MQHEDRGIKEHLLSSNWLVGFQGAGGKEKNATDGEVGSQICNDCESYSLIIEMCNMTKVVV